MRLRRASTRAAAATMLAASLAVGPTSSAAVTCDGAWHTLRSPEMSTYNADSFLGVAARSPNDLIAVGSADDFQDWALALRFDGRKWTSPQMSASWAISTWLNDVTITSDGTEIAVGSYDNGYADVKPVWTGTSGDYWVMHPAEVPSAGEGVLDGVDSFGRRAIGVGWEGDATHTAMIQLIDPSPLDLSATIMPVPTPGDSSELHGVALLPRNRGYAVGSYRLGGMDLPLVVKRGASGWQQVDLPSMSGSMTLTDVVAFAPQDVWVVGAKRTNPGATLALPFALHRDDTGWHEVGFPVSATGELRGITAAGEDLWAVGATDLNDTPRGVTFRWNGKRWKEVPFPSGSGTPNDVIGFPSGAVVEVGGSSRTHAYKLCPL